MDANRVSTPTGGSAGAQVASFGAATAAGASAILPRAMAAHSSSPTGFPTSRSGLNPGRRGRECSAAAGRLRNRRSWFEGPRIRASGHPIAPDPAAAPPLPLSSPESGEGSTWNNRASHPGPQRREPPCSRCGGGDHRPGPISCPPSAAPPAAGAYQCAGPAEPLACSAIPAHGPPVAQCRAGAHGAVARRPVRAHRTRSRG